LFLSPVQKVSVHHTGLQGPLPTLSIPFNTSQLRALDLSFNPALTGAVPAGWGGALSAMGCLMIQGSTGLCGPVTSGLPCFNKTGTNLGESRFDWP